MPSIKFANYKSFGREPEGLDEIKPINVLIGRNNSGKTALLEAVQMLVNQCNRPDGNKAQHLAAYDYKAHALVERDLPKLVAQAVRRSVARHDDGSSWRSVRLRVVVPLKGDGESYPELYVNGMPYETFRVQSDKWQYYSAIASRRVPLERSESEHVPSFFGRRPYMVRAERRLEPETDGETTRIGELGEHAVQAFHMFERGLRHRKPVLLSDLHRRFNEIMQFHGGEANLATVQEEGTKKIHLTLAIPGSAASPTLNECGSGIRSVVMTLIYNHLGPHLTDGKPLKESVLLYEEPENNLHPLATRRLLEYIRGLCKREQLIAFISTHSSIAIDLFAGDKDAQIVHLSLDENGHTRCRAYPTLHAHGAILDDLGVRASDLLQANGIVWVEGPSDRIYVNEWIRLETDGELREGLHYQVAMYGGSNLSSHGIGGDVTSDSKREKEFIDVLRVNRNALLLCDRDAGEGESPAKARVRELLAHSKGSGVPVLVTAPYEVEHYVPHGALLAALDVQCSPEPLDRNVSVSNALNASESGLGAKYSRDKVGVARRVVASGLTRADWAAVDGWDALVGDLVGHVRRWNT